MRKRSLEELPREERTDDFSSVHVIVAAVEEETRGTIRIERLLLLGQDGKPLKLLGGTMFWKIDIGEEMRIKFALAMIACQGNTELMRQLSPDRISIMSLKAFNELLLTINVGVDTPESEFASLN